MFYFDEINGKKILKSDLLECVPHLFTTRETIIKSKDAAYDALIEENKRDICKFLNVDLKNFISPSQTHTANIAIAEHGKNDYPETDGLILTNHHQAVFLNFADCTPVIIYDKKKNKGAVVHAGWRGTVKNIAGAAVEKMIDECNSDPKNIIAAIGPAISKCCFTVGEEVYEKLYGAVIDKKDLFEERNGDFFVDLKGINRRQLLQKGVKDVDVCPYCTVCDNDMFFSYRKEHATTCRHSAILKLRNTD